MNLKAIELSLTYIASLGKKIHCRERCSWGRRGSGMIRLLDLGYLEWHCTINAAVSWKLTYLVLKLHPSFIHFRSKPLLPDWDKPWETGLAAYQHFSLQADISPPSPVYDILFTVSTDKDKKTWKQPSAAWGSAGKKKKKKITRMKH